MLEARDLIKEYKIGLTDLRVIKGVDLFVGKGEIVGIIGPSGAGKSTLLNLIGGLDEPTSGKVLLEGSDISYLSDSERAKIRNKRFGFVFQFYHLLSEFTALENVMLPLIVSGQEKRKIAKDKASDILDRCGLSKRLNHRPQELSGGEQQRVAIARSIINMPEILFCDEPTGNLDANTGIEIKNLLWKLNKEFNTTLVIVSHSQEFLKDTTRTIQIHDGKIVKTLSNK